MVFGSRFAQLGAWSLVAFLLIQPVAPVFASELGTEPAPIMSEEQSVDAPAVEQVASVIEAVKPESNDITIEESADEEELAQIEEDVVLPDVVDTISEVQEVPKETEEAETGESTQDTPGEELSHDPDVVDTIDDDPIIEDEEGDTEDQNDNQETGSSDPEDMDPSEVISDVSTTTEDVQDPSALQAVHNAGAYQFDTKECTSVGDGAYYCSEKSTDTHFLEDGVFAAPDADGDLEIFVRLAGKESQITKNERDDSAPYYDQLSSRIVWHSLINDRYQIVSYDIHSGTESVITDTAYNNMEPVAYGTATIWQAWINGNWEIMFLDGGKIQQLTNNAMHDVSPHMREDHVVWQTQYNEGWQITVYDIETRQVTSLPSVNGAKIENPRFVLVYDTTNEAGDIQTMGYDPDENRSFLLNSIPVELPDELPEPDQTGETRALIQNKASVKGNEIEDIEPTPTPTASSSDPHASSTDSLPTLDMRTSTGTLMSASTTIAMSDIEDLVISSSTPLVEEDPIDYVSDLVIPPSASTTAE